ncbi:hypothetical protein [Aquamicrobium zhengzhouense]|uniref:Uncharacterized protein n=1 Tax=Aquamicrobium zhengzhouense TaxID=2781738 RepID=A0ABS0SA18_9HYPH|nr:hypothetical protein [Aquamicrobium zhengzhouense]MBI1620130.1 hypothetical protein [Aquamicrobium zhengzhouense]
MTAFSTDKLLSFHCAGPRAVDGHPAPEASPASQAQAPQRAAFGAGPSFSDEGDLIAVPHFKRFAHLRFDDADKGLKTKALLSHEGQGRCR